MDRDFWNYDGASVAGTSMLPLFRFAFIFWKHGRMPKVGELVCYRSEGYDEEGRFNPKKKGNVCHRCIGIEGDIFLIKGFCGLIGGFLFLFSFIFFCGFGFGPKKKSEEGI